MAARTCFIVHPATMPETIAARSALRRVLGMHEREIDSSEDKKSGSGKWEQTRGLFHGASSV
jgi:hypothetical protein